MADYTAFVEAGNALVELLRESLTPEPVSKRELISLCSPYDSDNNQLTVFLYHMEEDKQGAGSGYIQQSLDVQRGAPSRFTLSFLITAHSKAPVQMREADQYRLIGASIQILKDTPVLPLKFMQGSILETNANIHISIERPNFDQMIKIWNNNSKPYKLSVVCKLDGVVIDSKRSRRISRVTDVEIGVEQKGSGDTK